MSVLPSSTIACWSVRITQKTFLRADRKSEKVDACCLLAQNTLNVLKKGKKDADCSFRSLLGIIESQRKRIDPRLLTILESCLACTTHFIDNEQFKSGVQLDATTLEYARRVFLGSEVYWPYLYLTFNHPRMTWDAVRKVLDLINDSIRHKVDFLFGLLLDERASTSLRKRALHELLSTPHLESYCLPFRALFIQPDLPEELLLHFLKNFTKQATKKSKPEAYRLIFLETLKEWIFEWPQVDQFSTERVDSIAHLIKHVDSFQEYKAMLFEAFDQFQPETISQFEVSLFDFMLSSIVDETHPNELKRLYAKKITSYYRLGSDRLPSLKEVLEGVKDPALCAILEEERF